VVASFSGFYKRPDFLPTRPIIHSIARHAVAHDKVLEAADVAFSVDARGNVVIVEPESQTSLRQEQETPYVEQDRHIIVPRQEAYERIAHAAHKQMELLRSLYELTQVQVRRWSCFSWIAVSITMFGALLTLLLAVFLDIPFSGSPHISLLTLLMGMNIATMLVVGYLLWRAQWYSKQANTYFDSFLEIENFYEVINIVSELSVDDTMRGLLQEIVIAQSLGLQSRDIAIQDEDALSPQSR
jgi:hypothetical protein